MEYKPYDPYTANAYPPDLSSIIQQAMQQQVPTQNYAPPAQMTPAYNTMNPFTAALMQRLSQNNNVQGLLNADSANPNLAQSPGLLSQGLAMPQGTGYAMPTTGGPAAIGPWDYSRLTGDFWKNIYKPAVTPTPAAAESGSEGSGGGGSN